MDRRIHEKSHREVRKHTTLRVNLACNPCTGTIKQVHTRTHKHTPEPEPAACSGNTSLEAASRHTASHGCMQYTVAHTLPKSTLRQIPTGMQSDTCTCACTKSRPKNTHTRTHTECILDTNPKQFGMGAGLGTLPMWSAQLPTLYCICSFDCTLTHASTAGRHARTNRCEDEEW